MRNPHMPSDDPFQDALDNASGLIPTLGSERHQIADDPQGRMTENFRMSMIRSNIPLNQ